MGGYLEIFTSMNRAVSGFCDLCLRLLPKSVVRLLLKTGSDVQIENRGGWTPFQLAVLNGHDEVERLLALHGPSEPDDFYGLQQLFLVQ